MTKISSSKKTESNVSDASLLVLVSTLSRVWCIFDGGLVELIDGECRRLLMIVLEETLKI
jgi:hypothetical protein